MKIFAAGAFHCSAEIYFKFSVVAFLESSDAQHGNSVVGHSRVDYRIRYGRDRRRDRADRFTDGISQRNYRQSARDRATKIDLSALAVRREIRIRDATA